MDDIDSFASELLEEAKRFLERAKSDPSDEGKSAFLHAAILLVVCGFEAFTHSISDEMAAREGLSIPELSILKERKYVLDKGVYCLTKNQQMYRLLDRVEFIFARFSLNSERIDRECKWWTKLHQGIELRNSLVHPKERQNLTYDQVKTVFEGILEALDVLFRALYGRHFPSSGRQLDSRMTF